MGRLKKIGARGYKVPIQDIARKSRARVIAMFLVLGLLIAGSEVSVAARSRPTIPSDCNQRMCGTSPSGALCGVCPPRHTCVQRGSSAECVRTPTTNCTNADWRRECEGWNTTVIASSVCAAAVSACLGLAGGPIAGPACYELAAFLGCGWALAELQMALEDLQRCTDFQIRCSPVNDPSRPLLCDPRGTPGASTPPSYCTNCCLMAYPYHRGRRGEVVRGPNDEKRASCYSMCLGLGQVSSPPGGGSVAGKTEQTAPIEENL